MNIVQFPSPAKIAPDEGTIKMLEEMLARVRSGEITHVGLAGVSADGGISTSYTSGRQIQLLAAVTYLQYRINRFMEEP